MKRSLLALLIGAVFLPSFSCHTEVDREFVVLLDPAHGGADDGYTSANGSREKNLTLSIANQIRTMAQGRNIEVILTRREDQTLSLSSRLKQIEDQSPDIFLSLHLGASPFDTSLSGFRFITSIKDSHQEKTHKFAGLLASALQDIDELPINPSQTANFVVLKNEAAPSLLIEIGYLTNNDNCEFIQKPDNQKKISEKILSAIVQYQKSEEK